MSKPLSTKSKPVPWIPPGTSISKNKKPTKPKPITKYKKDDPVSPKSTPKKTVDIPKEENTQIQHSKNVEPDVESLSSHSSHEAQNEPDIHLFSIFQEMKLLYIHFASLKTSYLSAHRLIDSQEMRDSNINELFIEAGTCVKELNSSFDDLEYSVSVLENTLDENQKMQEYSKVLEDKRKLFAKLFDMYEKVIIIFQSVFEKQDFREMCHLKDSLSKEVKLSEKKCISQEAIIKDLERRLSIYQSKTNALESYKTNLESAKAELEKQLLYKESQIKYLNSELMNASGKQAKSSDHEEFIEIIENIKSKAHAEKSALKKALKFQKAQSQKHEEQYQNLTQELNEKEKMIFEIASQRDQLKVQLTVVSNNIIQQKTQIEEMKTQNLKLQNEMTEKDISHKKSITELQDIIEEKASELDKSVKAKARLEKTIEELENELQKSKGHRNNVKEVQESQTFVDLHKSKQTDDMHEEIQCLISLLQNSKEIFENLKQSSHVISAAGDHAAGDAEFASVQSEILSAVKETKEHLLQLKNMYKTFLQEYEQKQFPEQKDQSMNNDLEKQFKKLEQLYNAAMKENEDLKQEIGELKNSRTASPTVQKTENYFTTNIPSDNLSKKLRLELIKKSDDIRKMNQKERDLEDQLKHYKDKLGSMEVDVMKISSLEEELKQTKLELSIIQKKKEEETERLLQRIKDLQDSLDLKIVEYEHLQRHLQFVKTSYFNVFGDQYT